ncbi:hypothetical protein H0H93_016366 [Arthromyces matolae]|nr:hypothetical protein H0H93_016366 [Arthromyces matolae]
MAIYWGQGDGSGQKLLAEACSVCTILLPSLPQSHSSTSRQDDSINAIPLSVSGNGAFQGTNLPKCEFLANDIKECQNRGKIVTISLGGGGGSVGFDSAAQAERLADTIWNTFLGGSSDTRPFGDVVLDGSVLAYSSMFPI